MKKLLKVFFWIVFLFLSGFIVLGGFGLVVTSVDVNPREFGKPVRFTKEMAYFRFDAYPETGLVKSDDSSVMYVSPRYGSTIKMLENYYPDVSVTVLSDKEPLELKKILEVRTPWFYLDKTNYDVAVLENKDGVTMEVLKVFIYREI